MFRGVTHLNLDAKGRMAFPAKYRERLQSYCDGELVVTIHLPRGKEQRDRALVIYPLPEWQGLERQLQGMPAMDHKGQAIRKLLMGYANECQVDGAGRILLSSPLREFAQLDKKLVLVGQGDRLELWSESIWQSCTEDWLAVLADGEPLSEAVASLTL
ncbi:division/cell wall cluster transcriptional repressor MraZ [Alkalilimnicola sp. S0819]|uniref:division/cell wall cluster transcriptional repressor MraZ n=1 Tax=Alkalilimnicola sp. S0819 TaxID=2613922 RepID=UPI001261D51F|nr:division/cell wall cluster transcriptional repressor MraZ [Alkalilimnicola sp. S0819]KAB7623848.1 division/cell wall cluster transcriptional repressor MraZ [Alkalilimnicola sp. S0819]MPQ16724.1 division/cell wall cluster transcriptional repressor MraZ [Alkalilimnicola sp. S0819]